MEQVLGSSSEDVLREVVTGGSALTTAQRRTIDLSDRIKGWGSDLDWSMRPGVPRDKAPEIGVESLYVDMPRQQPRARIHKSTEHAQLTPVFGSACPPRGLSGRLRDIAYRYSEGRMARWLTLMLADRVDVVEGVAEDLAELRVPNVVKEMGLRSEWRHNRARFITTLAIAGVCTAALATYLCTRRNDD